MTYRGPAMRSGKMHWGTDYDTVGFSSAPTIHAIADGVVVWRATTVHAGYGYYIEVRHPNGLFSFYGHMAAPGWVGVGQTVSRGTALGTMGNTGYSFGTHLHIELRTRQGVPESSIDSYDLIHNAPLPGTSPPPPPPPPPPPTTLGEDEMLFLKAESNGSSGYSRAGEIYRRVEGSWIGVASLEAAVLVYALADKGALVAPFGGNDVELMFATDGLWEQSTLTGSVSSSRGPLTGRGYRTGRRIYPGAPGRLGQWHYPHEIGTATP